MHDAYNGLYVIILNVELELIIVI